MEETHLPNNNINSSNSVDPIVASGNSHNGIDPLEAVAAALLKDLALVGRCVMRYVCDF